MSDAREPAGARKPSRWLITVLSVAIIAPLCGALLPPAVRDFVLTAALAGIFGALFPAIVFLVSPAWRRQAGAFWKLAGLLCLFFLMGMVGYGMRFTLSEQPPSRGYPAQTEEDPPSLP